MMSGSPAASELRSPSLSPQLSFEAPSCEVRHCSSKHFGSVIIAKLPLKTHLSLTALVR